MSKVSFKPRALKASALAAASLLLAFMMAVPVALQMRLIPPRKRIPFSTPATMRPSSSMRSGC